MGRKAEKPKYNVLSARVDDEELQRILACAESADQRRNDLVMGLVRDGMKSRGEGATWQG